MTLCNSYKTGAGYCEYGVRCQFGHISRDFSDFDSQKTRYQNLLDENATIMKSRIDTVADPDVNTFNIAMPNKNRLSVFGNICSDATKTDMRKNGSKKQSKVQKKLSRKSRQDKRTRATTATASKNHDGYLKRINGGKSRASSEDFDSPSLSEVLGFFWMPALPV